MTARSDNLTSAIAAAVQRYLDWETDRASARAAYRPLSPWKSVNWRTIREANHHPTNLWKQAPWR